MSQGFSMGGKIAAKRLKKQSEQKKREARKRLQDAVLRTYEDPISGCVVTVLRADYAWGAEPQKGVPQRDYQRMRVG